MTEPTGNEIAVIGLAGAFPGAPDLPTFWRNLRGGVESVRAFDDAELETSPVFTEALRRHPGFVPVGAVLDGADLFDHDLFGIPRREATWMDPQQRVFLQLAWAAMEDGGYDPARYGGRVSVYAGAGNSGHLLALLGRAGGDPASMYEAVGSASADNLATRVSFLLRLRGESMNVHTACSTGLTVVHLACQSLLLGQSGMALAGAVSIAAPQRTGYVHQEGMILSPDGHCRAFDHRAGGTVPGNGGAVVLLKALDDALADGDHVHAVIRGSAVNNEGHRSVGYTAPSVAAQTEVVAEALAFAGVDADEIGYVEAHGTGTPLGDPIEIAALTRAFRRTTGRVADCPIGSVKTNIGHLDTAAGIAGLVKVILMLRHGELPPSLHLEQPNPAIDFDAGPFVVGTRLRRWNGDRPRVAGVSSFGIGGTNVHAVLAQAPPALVPPASARPHHLVTLAAHTPQALATLARELATALDPPPAVPATPDTASAPSPTTPTDTSDVLAAEPVWAGSDPAPALADVAFTRAVGRAELRYRRTHVAADVAELVDALQAPAADGAPVTGEPRVAFLFPGQGAASHGMAADVHRAEPVFRDELDRCLAELEPRLERPLLPVLLSGSGPIEDPTLGHAALFAVEYALARLLIGWGVRPAALLGHSFGEYAAACLAGVFPLEHAAELAVARGRLVAGLPAGAMLAVGLDEESLAPYLDPPLELAAVNGDARCVVSGPVPEVDALRTRLAADGHATVALPVGHAFHSAAVEPALEPLRAAATAIGAPGAPEVPLLSSRTGTWWSDGGISDGGPDHWARQMRDPVRFGPALDTLAATGDGPLVLVEVGPGQALTALALAQLGRRAVVTPALNRPSRHGLGTRSDPGAAPGHRTLMAAVGTLWRSGVPIDWHAFHAAEPRRRVPLPHYPFTPTDCALTPAASAARPAAPGVAQPAAPGEWHIRPVEPSKRAIHPINGAVPAAPDSTPSQEHLHPLDATNGALDPDNGATQQAQPGVGRGDGPRDDVERRVFDIWAERLGTDDFGVHDNFLELGGNSLVAAQLITRLRAAFTTSGTALPLAALFEAPTVAGIADRLRAGSAPGDDVEALPPIVPVSRGGDLPLSVVQARTLAMEAVDPGNPGLAMPFAIELSGALDLAALHRAVDEVVRRHETLRTTFHRSDDDTWTQRVQPPTPVTIELRDLTAAANGEPGIADRHPDGDSTLPDAGDAIRPGTAGDRTPTVAANPAVADRVATAQRLAREEARRAFDLSRSPLRLCLLRLADDRHVLLVTLHHVVSDTLSMVNFVGEIAAAYQGLPLPPLTVQYVDFAAWQRRLLAGGAPRRQRAFWHDRLRDLPPPLALPTDRPRASEHGIRSSQLAAALPAELSGRVARLGHGLGATPFVTLLAAYAALLSRVTGADDLVVGTPIGNREHGGLEPLIGYVAHAVPLRLDLAGDPSFTELVARTRRTLLDAHAHPDVPYESLVDPARERLFDAMFVLHSGIPQEQSVPGMTWRLWEVPDMPAMFGATLATVSLMLADAPQGFAGNLEYADELFDASTARRIVEQFATLVDDAVSRPEARVSELTLDRSPTTATTKTATTKTAPTPDHWVDRWAAVVAADPHAVAVVGPDATLTRAELAADAHRIAAALRERGARSVRLDLPPSARRLAALLGALRANCTLTDDPAATDDTVALDDTLWTSREWQLVSEHQTPLTSVSTGRYLTGLDRVIGAEPGPLVVAEAAGTTEAALDLLWAVCAGRQVRVVPDTEPTQWVPPADRDQRKVQFSLSYFANDEDSLTGPKYDLLLDGVRRADELGLAAVWTPERHFHSFGGLYPSPTATSAALAAASTRIGIRAGSVVLPLHEPVRVAEDWAVIDNLSGGRVGVSFASGWHPDDFVLAPDRYATRRSVMDEGIDVVRRLWRGETVRRRNGVGEEVEVAIRPRPVQPELPFWLTAAGSPGTFRRAGELGAFVLTNLMAQNMDDLAERIALYREAWRAAGHPGDGHVTLMLHTFLADDRERAHEDARGPLLRYFRSSVGIARGFAISQGLAIRPEDLSEDDLQTIVEHGLERYLDDGGLFGTPDSCAPMVERVRELGVDELAALVDFGVSAEATLRCVELLAVLADRESARARAAAETAARDVAARVSAVARLIEDADAALVQASPDLLAWLAEVAPGALAGRTLLAPSEPPCRVDGASVLVRHHLPDGRWVAARTPCSPGPELTVHPAPGAVQVVDAIGRDLGVGVVGMLLLDGTPTGQHARRHPDGRLDLLPPAAPRPAPRPVPDDGTIRAVGRDRPLPLSYAQQRLWYLDQLVPGNLAYNNTVALRMRGPLDTAALHRALREVVRRHEVLRTTIDTTDDGAVQVIHPAMDVDLPVVDVSGEIQDLVREHARTPFDLATGPLLRAHLLRRADKKHDPEHDREHVLVIAMHHIVSDGWSAGVLLGELATLYGAFAAGEPSPLPPLSVQYADYAVWQRNRRDSDGREPAYWADALADVAVLELPMDRPRGPVQGQRGARSPVHVDADLTAAVGRLCRDTGVTPYMVLHAALVTLLHRYSGQTDLAVGTAVAGRNQPETEQLVGCFINTVVVRADLSGDPSFRELLGRVKDATLGAIAHQELPFERLVDELDVPRSLSHAPLVQAMLVLHNTPAPRVRLGELTLEGMDVDSGTAKLDLVLELREEPDGITGAWEYNTDLFDAETPAQLTRHLVRLLTAATADPGRRVSELDLTSAGEREDVLALSAGPPLPAGAEPAADTVPAAFDAQVARTPEAVAVGDPDRPVTYRELRRRAAAVAHGLVGRGVRRGDRVALLVERPADAIAAMLGVLLAGAAYVPVDPHAPPARRDALLARAEPATVLTGADVATLINGDTADVTRPTDTAGPSGPLPDLVPSDPAYVIFTSGSTGHPKGVVVEHGQLLRSTRARRAHYGPPDVCLNLYALTFDGSVAWIYYALLTGGTVWCPTPEVVTEPHRLAELVASHRPRRLATVPALYRQLLAAASPAQLASLRSVTVGGEDCPPELVRAHAAALPNTELHNEYGPTEATVWSTVHVVDRPVGGRVPIGRPIPGARNYVLDPHGRLLPTGAAGELHVGGPAVARGYLGDPALTGARFVPDPFWHNNSDRSPYGRGDADAARLYGTGDRARWNRDGMLEFLGRVDRQVKIRGFRVEPAEVEAVLVAHPAVAEAAVVATDGRLVGYLAPTNGAVDADELRAFAGARLPDHLVPAHLVTLPALPRTRHGKVDVRALPAPDRPADAAPVAPRTELERTLAEVVAEVLRRPAVGVHDDFFAIGGDSILAMSVVTAARRRSVGLTVRQLFHNPTVARLATVAGTRLDVQAEQGTLSGPVPLSPVQRWFFDTFAPDTAASRPDHFNMSVQLELREPVRPDVLEEAFRAVLHHHDALRLRFVTEDGRRRQHGIAGEPGWTLDRAGVSGDAALVALDQRLQESLDLSDGPVVRAALVDRGPGAADRLLLVAHHLVTDAVSWRIVLADLFTAYHQLDGGHPAALPPKTTSYAEWSRRLAEFAAGPDGRAELDHWAALPYHLAPRLPRDSDSDGPAAGSSTVRVEVDATALLGGAVPVDHAVLTAVGTALARWTDADHVLLDVERHGREDLFPDLDVTRTVGWFSDFHPVVLPVLADPADTLAAVTAHLRSVPHHGAGYLPLRYADGSPLGAAPAAEVAVNYLGRLDLALPPGAPATILGEQLGSLRAASTPRPYLIEVTAGILDGRLWLVWTYTDGVHHRSTIERLAHLAATTLTPTHKPHP